MEEINLEQGKKHPWEREWSYGWSLMRIGAYLRRQAMDDLDRWYLQIGRALHEHGRKIHDRSVASELAEEAGFGSEVIEKALGDPTTSDEVKADHDRAVREFGAFGVPTLVVRGDKAVFGPVVAPAPLDEDAIRLWNLVLELLDFPGLYELKRPKTAEDNARIAAFFSPYITARDWRTVEKPAP